MDSFARNALRLSLAGAGIVVIGAGFVGQAYAAEAPGSRSTNDVPPAEHAGEPVDAAPQDVFDADRVAALLAPDAPEQQADGA